MGHLPRGLDRDRDLDRGDLDPNRGDLPLLLDLERPLVLSLIEVRGSSRVLLFRVLSLSGDIRPLRVRGLRDRLLSRLLP